MKKLTREWVRKAENDYLIAKQSSRSATPLHDGVCFHSQQCAEKYLKALLEEEGLKVPRTHNLDDLLNLLPPYHAAMTKYRRGLIFLTDFAVEVRYPGRSVRKRQAEAALRWVRKVRKTARILLELR